MSDLDEIIKVVKEINEHNRALIELNIKYNIMLVKMNKKLKGVKTNDKNKIE